MITGRHPLEQVPELLTEHSDGIKDVVLLNGAL
jgi:hypothetical protein